MYQQIKCHQRPNCCRRRGDTSQTPTATGVRRLFYAIPTPHELHSSSLSVVDFFSFKTTSVLPRGYLRPVPETAPSLEHLPFTLNPRTADGIDPQQIANTILCKRTRRPFPPSAQSTK